MKEWMLRTCAPDLSSYGGFKWPRVGPVEAPDWNPEPVCGYGLHGLLRGQGEGQLLRWDETAVWLVVEVDSEEIVDLSGKVKAPRGVVIYAGGRLAAIAMMQEKYPAAVVVGGSATAGDYGTAIAGLGGTATAGAGGIAVAGRQGTATVGDGGEAIAGLDGTATAGDGGSATAGDYGKATAGDGGTATTGQGGTATAGGNGTATAGDYGEAIAGTGGTAVAGIWGTAVAGLGGTIILKCMDGQRVTGYVGEGGLTAGGAYRLDAKGRFISCERESRE